MHIAPQPRTHPALQVEISLPIDPERVARATCAALGRQARVKLSGEFDIFTAQCITAALAPLISLAPKGDGGEVVMNLAHVQFMDSSGLAALSQGVESLRQQGWQCQIDLAPPRLRKLLDYAVSVGWLRAALGHPTHSDQQIVVLLDGAG